MKKSKALSIVFSIASIALITWTILLVAMLNGAFTDKGTSWPTDSPSLQGVTKSNGYYDISLFFSATNYSRQLQNIIINPQSSENVAGLTGSINGTAVNASDPVFSYCLKSGDSLQINVLIPCADFASGTSIGIQVLGDCFMSGGTVLLP